MSVPTEVVEDILSRLPVESLLRFRCVCPPWRDLIDSPHFVKLHLNRSIQTETNLNLTLQGQTNKSSLHAAQFDPSSSSLAVEAKELLHQPLRAELDQVWGSCNGLLCLGDASHNNIVIWNPSTRRSVNLPVADLDFKRFNLEADLSNYHFSSSFRIGYDSVGDDYKVVRLIGIVRLGSTARANYIMVYSLKTHSWHYLEKPFNNLRYLKSEPSQSSTNYIHWVLIMNMYKPGVIVEFDLHTETCRIVPGPTVEDTPQYINVEPFQESICALYINSNVDLWVMREYGVVESWAKLCSFLPKVTKPVYVPMKSRGIFMKHDGKFLWFDTENDNPWYEYDSADVNKNRYMKNIEVRGLKNFHHVGIYVASLVPLGRFSKMCDEKKPKEKRKKDMSIFCRRGSSWSCELLDEEGA